MKGNTIVVPVRSVVGQTSETRPDLLAVEEPLAIVVNGQTLALTMRTPGHDSDLARGYLYTEGVIDAADQILSTASEANTILVELEPGTDIEQVRLERSGYVNSSCGICGKTSIQALETLIRGPLPPDHPRFAASLIHTLPALLRQSQQVFDRTGGLHAAALFSTSGTLLAVREDVGRHNAVDKLIGAMLLQPDQARRESLMLVSGRAGFELVQKALAAGIPIMAAVGAPSSLAVAAALRFGMTLLGFVRDDRFNVYSGASRIE